MAKTIKPGDLGAALQRELTVFHRDVVEKVDNASETAVKKLVKLTKASAPVRSGSFKKNIASKLLEKRLNGSEYIWYVKAPDHRVTHLIVHGHATRTGGRTRSNPFLQNALDTVLPEYEKAIEEAVKQ